MTRLRTFNIDCASVTPAHLKKMQAGLKKYRADMQKLRVKAAKVAKITDGQWAKYIEALKSPECIAEGRLASVSAAKIAKIPDSKFKAFSKAYKILKAEYSEKKAVSKSGTEECDTQSQEILEQLHGSIRELRKLMSVGRSESERRVISKYLTMCKLSYDKLESILDNCNSDNNVAKASNSRKAVVSDETQVLLDKTYSVADFLNLIQSNGFYDWYAGPLSSWLAGEKESLSSDKIVKSLVTLLDSKN